MSIDKMQYIFLAIMSMALYACHVSPSPIDYGEDQCAACKMIISDNRFGVELVTHKGKVSKYDAVECMLPTIREKGQKNFANILVTDFNRAGHFVDAQNSFFLISPSRPSPMGGNLSAYTSANNPKKWLEGRTGKLYTWEQLLEKE